MRKILITAMIIPALIAGAFGAACLTVNSAVDELIDLDNVVSTESSNASRTVSVGNFTKLEVSSKINIKYTVGKRSAITISAPKNVISNVLCVVENGTLKIELKSLKNYDVYPEIEVQFSAPAVNSIKMSGACTITVSGIYRDSDKVNIDISGASVLKFKNAIEANKMEIELNGASSMTIPKLSGTDVEIDLSGASRMSVNALKTQDLEIEMGGASRMTIDALKTHKLEADISGASDLTVAGNAKFTKLEASGASKINALNLDAGSLMVSKTGISQISTKM